MSEIKSRVFQYGDEKESSWPPRFGTGEHGIFHIDKETGKLKKGYAPREEKLGEAPLVFFDDIKPTRHPYTGNVITTKKAWDQENAASGCIECKEPIEPKKTDMKKLKADYDQALERAIWQCDNGEGLGSRDPAAGKYFEIADKAVSEKLGFDASNVLGRKKKRKR